MEVKDKLIVCNLCGNNEFTFLFNGHDYLFFSPLVFQLMKCNKCGLVCLNPQPANIINYYDAYRKENLKKDAFLFLSPDRVKKIKKFKNSGKILDIGCGKGEFLFDMSREGWDVYGCDIYPNACDLAKKEFGLKNIYNDDLLSLNFPENSFDVITLWHVLEHLTKPLETLKKINQILKDDGVLIIESPDFSSIQSKFFKSKWFALDLPRHLFQFSPKTLEKILKLANFKIFKRDYIVNPRITFISFKKSLLRYLGIERFLNKDESEESIITTHFRKAKILWRLSRSVFNLFCVLFSLFLALIHCEDSFRVYCKKISGRKYRYRA